MSTSRETCEIQGLNALQDYLAVARAGAGFDSLGPLLALSLVDVAGGMRGPELFGIIDDLAVAMHGCRRDDAAGELLRGGARGFAKSGDHQALADIIELANVMGARRSVVNGSAN